MKRETKIKIIYFFIALTLLLDGINLFEKEK
jgi:hypothetical protein